MTRSGIVHPEMRDDTRRAHEGSRTILRGEMRDDTRRAHEGTPVHRIASACHYCGRPVGEYGHGPAGDRAHGACIIRGGPA
jgi:hypothetical protein